MSLEDGRNIGPGEEMDEYFDDLSSDYRAEETESEPTERDEEVSYEEGRPSGQPVSQLTSSPVVEKAPAKPRRRAKPKRALAKAARKTKVKKLPARRAKSRKVKAKKKRTVKKPAKKVKKKSAMKRSKPRKAKAKKRAQRR